MTTESWLVFFLARCSKSYSHAAEENKYIGLEKNRILVCWESESKRGVCINTGDMARDK